MGEFMDFLVFGLFILFVIGLVIGFFKQKTKQRETDT